MILNTGASWEPEENDVIAWQRTYKKVDVHQELMAMESWLDANPAKRKTPKGIKSFIVRWLKKSDDQGGNSPIARKYNKAISLRAMTIDMALSDLSWVDPEHIPRMKEFYLQKYGHYFLNGELHGRV
jgi:hypothetical protein